MGLEEWYYNPPLPPFHGIEPEEDRFRSLLDGQGPGFRGSLVPGVEVYFRHPWADGKRFLRGAVVKNILGHLHLAARLERGGCSTMGIEWADIIPAEFVDAGLLGPECVLDMSKPGRCARCLAEIPLYSRTGRCTDKAACAARVEAEERADQERRWRRVTETVVGSQWNKVDVTEDLIVWADTEIARLRTRLSGVMPPETEKIPEGKS